MTAETEKAPAPEVIEPLLEMEAQLVAVVGQWREQQTKQLEIQYQRILSQSNERIAPVLRAHGLQPGDEWDIRQDPTSATGWAIAIKKGALAPEGSPAPVIPLTRVNRRRLHKEIRKKASRQGGR